MYLKDKIVTKLIHYHFPLCRAETQQLAKIYALLNENEDKFGKVSMKDIKSQMSMYKTD